MPSIASALQPKFRTSQVNETVRLYTGPIQFRVTDGPRQVNGADVSLAWLPVPRLRVSSSGAPPQHERQGLSIALFCEDFWYFDANSFFWHADWYSCIARLIRVQLDGSGSLHTFSFNDLSTGTAERLNSVVFHVVNFPNFIGDNIAEGSQVRRGRIFLAADGWEICLDNLRETADLCKQLSEIGGYAITHVGLLRRSDGAAFRIDDVKNILGGLYYFLSFARGRWVAPVLFSGESSDGEIWKHWGLPLLEEGLAEWSWPPRLQEGVALASAWPGFLKLWMDKKWQQALAAALSWYIEAARGALIESHLVTGQAALELLAWVEIVQRRGLLTENGFNSLPASEHLRLLLTLGGIPIDLPNDFPELKTRAAAFTWRDGPSALVGLRNGVVHPNISDRILGIDIKIRAQAWQLMMHYLRLALLRLFEYRGGYYEHLYGREATTPWGIA